MSALREINESYRSSARSPKGMNFARAARILAHSKNRMEAIEIAEATWGERSAPAAILKAAVAPPRRPIRTGLACLVTPVSPPPSSSRCCDRSPSWAACQVIAGRRCRSKSRA